MLIDTSETCQRSHYTNSGGHPVEIKSLDDCSICLATGKAAAFFVYQGQVRYTGVSYDLQIRLPHFKRQTAQGGSLYS